MSIPSWHSRRGDFNHQWLSNQYLTQLRYWVEMISKDSRGLDQEFEEEFLSTTLMQWERKSAVAHELADELECELSPRKLFAQAPLNRIPEDIALEMAAICHQLWLARTEKARRQLAEAIDRADRTYRGLKQCLSKRPVPLAPDASRLCTPLAQQFLQACQNLKSVFENLPKLANE